MVLFKYKSFIFEEDDYKGQNISNFHHLLIFLMIFIPYQVNAVIVLSLTLKIFIRIEFNYYSNHVSRTIRALYLI